MIAAAQAAASAVQTRNDLSVSFMRMNADALTQVVEMVAEQAQNAKALVAEGVGGNLDVSV